MLALAGAAVLRSPVAVVILLVCGVVAVSTNGLASTAIAEYAGSAWAGRALGIQNTGQNALAAATPPVLALSIGAIGFGGVVRDRGAVPAGRAAFVVPVAAEASGDASGDASGAGSVARPGQVEALGKLDDLGPGEPADAHPQG